VAERTWAALVPELACTDFQESLGFYQEVLGFSVVYGAPEAGFAYLELGKAQLMLMQGWDEWTTGAMERPFGRGINFRIEVDDVRAMEARLTGLGIPLFRGCQTAWYRDNGIERGQIEFLVQDPDGYLLRFMEPIGERPAAGTT
jgi:catechol 2,3-dioxygenase-like lactoylglutathione lyase family enzyme